MPFWRTYYHLVWATKNREPLITPKIEKSLYSYIVHKATTLGIYIYAADGWVDHAHVIAAIPPKIAVAEAVRNMKGASAHWLNEHFPEEPHFAWQRGYGVLSLGEKQRPQAEAYVLNQKGHHQQQTTNSWLERYEDEDEGPTDIGLPSPRITHEALFVKEPQPEYPIFDPFPF